jgi:hypothetical protein
MPKLCVNPQTGWRDVHSSCDWTAFHRCQPPSLPPPPHPRRGTLLLLIALNLLNYIDRYILPGEVSLIQREFHSTDQQMGALTTALFFFYMLPRR